MHRLITLGLVLAGLLSASVAVAAECYTYTFRGEFYFQDTRFEAPSLANDLGLAPAANARLLIGFVPSSAPASDGHVDWVRFRQARNGQVYEVAADTFPISPAPDLYVGLDGAWEVELEVCGEGLDFTASEAVVAYEYAAPKWHVVAPDGAPYVAVNPFSELADANGVVDFGSTTVVPVADNGRAMETFQSLRDAHLFTEYDGGCESLGIAPCGYSLGSGVLQYYSPAPPGRCEGTPTGGCTWDAFAAASTSAAYHVFHEFGHVQHYRVAPYRPPYVDDGYYFHESVAYAFNDRMRMTLRFDPAYGCNTNQREYVYDALDLPYDTHDRYGVPGEDRIFLSWSTYLWSLAHLTQELALTPPFHDNTLRPLDSFWASSGDYGAQAAMTDLRRMHCVLP